MIREMYNKYDIELRLFDINILITSDKISEMVESVIDDSTIDLDNLKIS